MSVDSEHTELSDIKETLDMNFIGTFALTKALIPVHPGPTTTDLNGNMALPDILNDKGRQHKAKDSGDVDDRAIAFVIRIYRHFVF